MKKVMIVRKFAEKVYVIFRGVIVEEGTKDQIFSSPGHPYTKALLSVMINNKVRLKSLNLHGNKAWFCGKE